MVNHVTLELSKLIPAKRNPNVMSDSQFESLKSFIKRVGLNQPILVRSIDGGQNYEIVDGHHRTKAARELGYSEIPAVIQEGSENSEYLALGYNINRGMPDLLVASEILADLVTEGMSVEELTSTGLEVDEITALLKSTEESVAQDINKLMAQNAEKIDESPKDPKPFFLEIGFESKKEFQRVKRALKKASAGTNDLRIGLLAIIEAT